MAKLKLVASALCIGDFVLSLDLSDAYFHIRVALSDRRFFVI